MDKNPEIGRVFTPLQSAMWLLEEVGAYGAWCSGATICDPNHGRGSFIAALFQLARRDGLRLTPNLVSAVFGCEINSQDRPKVLEDIYDRYGVLLRPENFTIGDALSASFDQEFDILIGNPPWCNFTNLPSSYKMEWADKFIEYKIVKNRKDVLLGASRADIATLIVKKVLEQNLHINGLAAFFLPLSIFFNSGSNDLFRPYPGSKHQYSVKELWDFADEKLFEGVSTRYGAVKFSKSEEQRWPVLTHVRDKGTWLKSATTSSDGSQGFWQRHSAGATQLSNNPRIVVKEGQKPRQGINTCGANDIFIFTKENNLYQNGLGEIVEIESVLLHPLIDKSNFSGSMNVRRYILVPHDNSTGRPLTLRQLATHSNAYAYLLSKRHQLQARKGTMLSTYIKRGEWWALLGVGPYSFAYWKVVWEALGKTVFRPQVFPGSWQGNQALHAYCPCSTRDEAELLKQALMAPSVEAYLQASAMGGTMNWAQPGRVGQLFEYSLPQTSLLV